MDAFTATPAGTKEYVMVHMYSFLVLCLLVDEGVNAWLSANQLCFMIHVFMVQVYIKQPLAGTLSQNFS